MKQALLFAAFLLAATPFAVQSEPIPPLKASSVTGVWLLHGNVRAVQFHLMPNGQFEYKGYGSKSTGKWNVEGNQVRLRWTKVDSMQVDPQQVTGLYPVADGAFTVGKFDYRKQPQSVK